MKKYVSKLVVDINGINGDMFVENFDGFYIDRQIGRTTGQAYNYIGQALLNPLTTIKIQDHVDTELKEKNGHGYPRANIALFDLIDRIVKKNQLQHITMNPNELTIRYDGVYEIEEVPHYRLYKIKCT